MLVTLVTLVWAHMRASVGVNTQHYMHKFKALHSDMLRCLPGGLFMLDSTPGDPKSIKIGILSGER